MRRRQSRGGRCGVVSQLPLPVLEASRSRFDTGATSRLAVSAVGYPTDSVGTPARQA